jgi:hypothetical protein
MATVPVYELYINSTPYYLADLQAVKDAIGAAIAGEGNFSFSWRKVIVKYAVWLGDSPSPLGTYDALSDAVTAAKGPISSFGDSGNYRLRIEKVVTPATADNNPSLNPE